MIAVLLAVSLMGWSYWMMFRNRQSPRAQTSDKTPARPFADRLIALGVEDDPDPGRGTAGGWTALDEHQLTRLLTNAAPTNRLATNPPDRAVPNAEHEDL